MLASPSAPLPPDPGHRVAISVPFRPPLRLVKPYTKVKVRWLIQRDMAAVLDIEAASSPRPWTEEDFLSVLRPRDTIGMIAERGEKVVAFMIYRFNSKNIDVINFAVAPGFRRSSVGSQMVAKLKAKLDDDFVPRDALGLCVRESNVNACLFFRSQGFLWRETLPEHYPDTNEDAYVMEYQRVEGDRVPHNSIGHMNAPEFMP